MKEREIKNENAEVYIKIRNAYGEINAADAVGFIGELIRKLLVEMSEDKNERNEQNFYVVAALIRANTELKRNIRLDELDSELKCMMSDLFISNLEGVKRYLGLAVPQDVQ